MITTSSPGEHRHHAYKDDLLAINLLQQQTARSYPLIEPSVLSWRSIFYHSTNKMKQDLIAQAETHIAADADKVWDALVNPAAVKKYMFGTTVNSDWQKGSAITWKGEWKGKNYEDKGTILQIEPPTKLQYTHFSPLSGLPEVPENYHTVTVELKSAGGSTHVSLTQDNNPTQEALEHSEKNWSAMLSGLKKFIEEDQQ